MIDQGNAVNTPVRILEERGRWNSFAARAIRQHLQPGLRLREMHAGLHASHYVQRAAAASSGVEFFRRESQWNPNLGSSRLLERWTHHADDLVRLLA